MSWKRIQLNQRYQGFYHSDLSIKPEGPGWWQLGKEVGGKYFRVVVGRRLRILCPPRKGQCWTRVASNLTLGSLAWMASLPERGCDDWEEDCGAGWQVLARKGFCRGLWGMNAWKGRQRTGQYRWVSLPIGTSGMGEWASGLLEKSGVSWGESWLCIPTRSEVRGGLVKHQRHGERGAWYCTPWAVCGFAHLQSSCLCRHCLRQSCDLCLLCLQLLQLKLHTLPRCCFLPSVCAYGRWPLGFPSWGRYLQEKKELSEWLCPIKLTSGFVWLGLDAALSFTLSVLNLMSGET